MPEYRIADRSRDEVGMEQTKSERHCRSD